MKKIFYTNEHFKYTVRGFLIGVVVTTVTGGLVLTSTVKAEKPEKVVVSDPIVTESIVTEPEEIIEEFVEEVAEPVIDEKELEMLAHLIGGEAGADWCKDEMLYYVGSVVLNRMNSKDFPNTMEGVIFQKGQYACTWDGNYNRTPSERCYRIAEQLLTYGSVLPENVVFQAEFKQGSGVYEKVQNMYFCYK